MGNAGSNVFKATYTPEDTANYETVSDIEVSIAVSKITPEYKVPENLTAVYGQTLKDVALPKGFSWQDPEDTAVGNVGINTFKVTYTPEDTANYYTVVNIDIAITVKKSESALDIQADKTQFTYGEPMTLTVKIALKPQTRSLIREAANTADFYLGDPADGRPLATADVKDGKAAVTIEKSNPNYPDAGSATLTVVYHGSESLDAGIGTLQINIDPAEGSASVSQADWTYGQPAESPVPVSETNGTGHVTYVYKQKDAEDSAYTTEVPTNAGDYTVRATFAATQNHKAVTAAADFTIAAAKPPITITPEEGKEIQVGQPVTLTIALKGVKDEVPKGAVAISGQTLELQDGQASMAYTPADDTPKTLTAVYTPAAGENYTEARASLTLTAGKKNREPIILEDHTKTYGDPAFILEPAGGSLQAGESYRYASDNETVATVDQTGEITLRQAGAAHITVSIGESSAWNPAEATMTLTVGKAQITGVTFEDATFTEDGAEHKIELTGSLPEGAAVTYENNVQKAPGTYTATAWIDGGVNYESFELTATLTITKKPVAPDKPVGPEKPEKLKTPEEIGQVIAKLPNASELGSLTAEEQTQVKETVDIVIESIAGLPPEQQMQIPQDDIIKLDQYGASPYSLIIDKDTSATKGHETHINEADIQIFGGGIAARAIGCDVKIILTQELPPDGSALAIRLKLYVRQKGSTEYIEAELKTPIVVQLRLPGHIKTQGLGIRHLNPDGSVKEKLVPVIKNSQASFMTTSFSRFLFVEASGLEPGPEAGKPTPGPEKNPLGADITKSHNTNTGLPGTGSVAGAAVLLTLAALAAIFAWQKSRKY